MTSFSHLLVLSILVSVGVTLAHSSTSTGTTKTLRRAKASIPYNCREEHYQYDEWDYENHRHEHLEECKEYWTTKNPSYTSSPTAKPTTAPTKQPTHFPTKNPTLFPTKSPTAEPTRSPTKSPTLTPTKSPTAEPTRSPTENPTLSPTKSPTPAPRTSSPTTRSPTKSPTPSSTPTTAQPTDKPSFIELFQIEFPPFELQLNYAYGNSEDNRRLDLIDFETKELVMVLSLIIDSHLNAVFSDSYYSLELFLGTQKETEEEDGIEVTFPFHGNLFFTSTESIPGNEKMKKEIMMAFMKDGVGVALNDASKYSFTDASVKTVGSSRHAIGIASPQTDVLTDTTIQGTGMLTIAASTVAFFSTLTALGFIYIHRRRMAEATQQQNSPTNAANEESSPMGIRKIRSPFQMTSTPVDGTRKYFCRLDDESVASSKVQSNGYLHPNFSMANSSLSKDEESSLEAPSMTGLSSIGGSSKNGESMKSLDGESLANMSALDEVRLGRVLNLEDSFTDENSLATVGTSGSKIARKFAFAKIWYGNKKQKSPTSAPAKSEDTNMLPPPTRDSPMKNQRSPSKPHGNEDEVAVEKKESDDNSLLGNQSDKGGYYGQKDESNLFYTNMLGDRSVNSLESDSIDFNEMYGADSSSYDDSSMGASSRMATIAGKD